MNNEIRKLLIDKAIKGRPIYYGEIMKMLGLQLGNQEDHNELSEILGEISAYENEHKRPLLSSIATYSPETMRQKGGETHGNGFYEVAEYLGKGKRQKLKKDNYAIQEMEACKKYWSNDSNYKQYAIINEHKIGFFREDEIDFIAKWGGAVYDKNDSEHIAAKNYIMNSLGSKTVYWSNELIKRLSGFDTFNWRMWSQKGWEHGSRVAKFKHYTWARIYRKGDDNKDIFFTVGADGNGKELVYKLDYYFEATSNLNAQQKEIVNKNIPADLRWKSISVEKFNEYDWDKLLEETYTFIVENTFIYDKLIALTWGGKTVEQVFKDYLRKQTPALIKFVNLPELNPNFKGYDNDHISTAIEKKEIGDAGEDLVVNYEKSRLRALDKNDLADKVKVVKDGEGYDVLSFNDLGQPLFVEVKTTRGNQDTPFHFTLNEYLFAERHEEDYMIYRLYNYDDKLNNADFYVIEQPLSNLLFQPTVYKAYNKQKEQ